MHEQMEATALAAARAGAAELRRRYRDGDDDADHGPHDVKAAADEAAEARMLPVVREAFPGHAVFAEEAGTFGGEGYRWIIDPLDGTNNFAAGLPTFASSVAVEELDGADAGERTTGPGGDPVLAAVVLPATGEAYVARRGEGVRHRERRVTADSDLPVEAATAAVVVGREVPRDPDLAATYDAIRAALDERVKRVVGSWAPTVHSGLLARGRVGALVQFHPDTEERAVTDLFAAEAGAAVRREGPLTLAASDDATADELWAALADAR